VPNEFIRIHIGDQFQVNLPEYGAAGYQWLPRVSDPNVVAVRRRSHEPPARTKFRPGDSVAVLFDIVALSPGVTTVVFEQKRPWEPDVVVAHQTVEVTVLASTP